MKKFVHFVGKIFIGVAIIFLLAHSFIVVSDGSIAKDIFGFTIPEPALWTSYVPYFGGAIAFVYQYFSMHGLVGLIISIFFFGLGINMVNFYKLR